MLSFAKRTVVAATLGLFALRACALSDVLPGGAMTGEADNSTLTKRLSNDCDLAQYTYTDVDCYYDFDKGGNFLNYVVKMTPTGQANDNSGWCTGIIQNMMGGDTCGRSPGGGTGSAWNKDWSHCNDYLTWNIHHPKTRQVTAAKGIDLNFHYAWPWTEGGDAIDCITESIKRATCAGALVFKNGKCYKRVI